jgi:hypothetical protein
MNLHLYKNWFFSMFTIVTLTTAAGYGFTNDSYSMESGAVQFSKLTDADIDLILAVKAEMYAAKNSI